MQQTLAGEVKQRAWFSRLADREGLLGAIFLAPAIIYIIALVGIPFLNAIAYSFSDVNVGNTNLTFVGLENFRAILNRATMPQFWPSFWQSIAFTIISQFFIVIFANILALVLAQDFRGKWIARMLIMMPWATPASLGVIGWLWLLDSKFAPIDWFLVNLGLLGHEGALLGARNHMNFLGRAMLARGSVILVHIWRTLPLSAVILMAGLTSIDEELIDQAKVDGAGFWRIHFKIRIPLITPIMVIALLFSLISTFADFVVVFILTRGGPLGNVFATHVLASWAFQVGIQAGVLDQGAAIALFLFPVLLAVAIFVLRAARRMEVT